MQILIEIPEEKYNTIKNKMYCGIYDAEVYESIVNGIPLDEKEIRLKRWIEKDIKMLNEIIESGWLISDLEKCPAIDACEDAITALKQYPVLDKVRAEIEVNKKGFPPSSDYYKAITRAVNIIDKYRGNVDAI